MLSTDSDGAADRHRHGGDHGHGVNDAPVNTVPGAQTVNEDTALPLPAALDRVNDVDGNLATTQLTVRNGTLTVSLAGGATISAGANGTRDADPAGTQAQINAALATLSYQGNAQLQRRRHADGGLHRQ